MLFNSFAFLFLFLPVSLLAWFGLHRLGYPAPAKFALILLSLLFYGLFSVWNVPVILVSILVNFALSRHLSALQNREEVEECSLLGKKRALLAAGVSFNILYLCAFKYASLYEGFLQSRFSLPEDFSILFPIGISYYTLSQISFLVDRYRGEVEHDTLLNYTLTTVFFPKLAEGPILRYGEVAPQFHDEERRRFSLDDFGRGLVLLVFGMAKKVLIADRLAPAAAFGFANAYYLDTLTVIVFLLAVVFQLYFDFSGYIDMALGIARMFRIDLPENFNAPFQARNFADFWRRWHMSLTGFFTRYVYIPLGGSRKGAFRTACNVILIFVLSGLWHGTSWNYLYWGVLSGILVVLARRFAREPSERVKSRAGVLALQALNTAVFAFTLVFFGAERLDISYAILRRFFYPTWPGFLYRMANTLEIPEFYILNQAVKRLTPGMADLVCLQELIFLLALSILLVRGRRAKEIADTMAWTKKNGILVGILTAWCLLSLQGVTTFLYFKF